MDLVMYLRWLWQRIEFWQKCFILAMFPVISSMFFDSPWDKYLYIAGMAVIISFFLKWTIWDGIRNSYAKFREEKETLFNKIRGE